VDLELFRSGNVRLRLDAIAQKGSVMKRIALALPSASMRSEGTLFECFEEIAGERIDRVNVPSHDKVDVLLTQSAEQIFRTALEPAGGALRFDALAKADDDPRWGNQDGTVTEAELSSVGLVQIAPENGAYVDPSRRARTLADFMSRQLAFAWQFGRGGRCMLPAPSSP
jgi:hypothetical protein